MRTPHHQHRGLFNGQERQKVGARFCLCAFDGGRFCTLAVADLLRSELASTNAATPARRWSLHHYRHWLPIRAPGSH